MNRRGFLASLLATAVLDPERLLWVPGQKKIFVPAPRPPAWGPLVGINLEQTRNAGQFHNGIADRIRDQLNIVQYSELDEVCRAGFDQWLRFWGYNLPTKENPVPYSRYLETQYVPPDTTQPGWRGGIFRMQFLSEEIVRIQNAYEPLHATVQSVQALRNGVAIHFEDSFTR